MIDPKTINDMVKNVIASLPPGLKNLPGDVEDNLKAALRSVFSQLDLVTREEFDVQVKVLQKTREKLEQLEKELREMDQEDA